MLTSLSRRDFVAACLASAGVASALAPQATLAAPPAVAPAPVRLALFDTRYPSAAMFSQAMARDGVALAPFDADVTAVWYGQLDPLWRREAIRVAGLTTVATLFCLERLAWDHGLRVAFLGTHDPAPMAGMRHLFEAAGDRPQDLPGGFSQERPWPAQVADHIASISDPVPAFPSRAEARSQSRLGTAASTHDSETRLVSWLIAPKAGGRSRRSA